MNRVTALLPLFYIQKRMLRYTAMSGVLLEAFQCGLFKNSSP